MERIRIAIEKAREARNGVIQARPDVQSAPVAEKPEIWDDLEQFTPSPRKLARNRIISSQQGNAALVHYDMMRTRFQATCKKNGWKTIGVTSPGVGCGKSVTATNLALSLAKQRDSRIVLIDGDMRRPNIGQMLGVTTRKMMASFLSGDGQIQDHFLRIGYTLAIGTNAEPSENASEVLLSDQAGQAMADLMAAMRPDYVLVDLPPMLPTDDVMAFLPKVDAMLLVAAAEDTKLKDVDLCERELGEQSNVMGVILNKCRHLPETQEYAYY